MLSGRLAEARVPAGGKLAHGHTWQSITAATWLALDDLARCRTVNSVSLLQWYIRDIIAPTLNAAAAAAVAALLAAADKEQLKASAASPTQSVPTQKQ
jgi:uncharacterized membrane protein